MRTEFGDFILDTGARQLFKDGQPVRLSRKAFDVLALLVERRPTVVSKDDFNTHVWAGAFVEDANLSVVMSEVRRALGDSPRGGHFIRTVDRVGYAFQAPAIEHSAAAVNPSSARAHASAQPALSRWTLIWNEQSFPLRVGPNTIGRNPGCTVHLDAGGVSRRHACILVDEAHHAVIEDLGSTNGTFVRGASVEKETLLRDGDVIQVGATELTVRTWADKPTERIRK